MREFEIDLGQSGNLPQNSKGQGKVRKFYCVKFIFSQFKNPNFENFLGQHVPTTLENGLGLTVEFNLSLQKSWKVREFRPFWRMETRPTPSPLTLYLPTIVTFFWGGGGGESPVLKNSGKTVKMAGTKFLDWLRIQACTFSVSMCILVIWGKKFQDSVVAKGFLCSTSRNRHCYLGTVFSH